MRMERRYRDGQTDAIRSRMPGPPSLPPCQPAGRLQMLLSPSHSRPPWAVRIDRGPAGIVDQPSAAIDQPGADHPPRRAR